MKSMLGAVLVAAVMALGTGASANIVTNVLYDWTQPYTADAQTIVLYHFNENTGTNVLDSSSNNYHARFSPLLAQDYEEGEDVWVAGDAGFGSAVRFPTPGVDEQRVVMYTGSAFGLNSLDAFSVQMRIKPDDLGGLRQFWGIGGSIGSVVSLQTPDIATPPPSINSLNIYWYSGAHRSITVPLSQSIVTGVWQEVTFIYRAPSARDEFNNQFQIWLNGQLIANVEADWDIALNSPGLHIGRTQDGWWPRAYRGAMDEFRIQDGAVAALIPEPSTGLLGLLGLLLLFIRRHPR